MRTLGTPVRNILLLVCCVASASAAPSPESVSGPPATILAGLVLIAASLLGRRCLQLWRGPLGRREIVPPPAMEETISETQG
jgi:hypothetical protein